VSIHPPDAKESAHAMKIKVQYLGPIRIILKKRDDLRKLTNTYGKALHQEVFEDDGDQLRESLVVTINGKAIGQLNGTSTSLKPGDIVTLLPLFAGGGSR
jgi:molybdopterin converting factor small subunit